MDSEFYRRYSHGSARFATGEEVKELSQGRGLIATVENNPVRFQDQPVIAFGGAGVGKFTKFGCYQVVHNSIKSMFILDVGAQYNNVTHHYNLALGRESYTLRLGDIGVYQDISHPVNLFAILKNNRNLFTLSGKITLLVLSPTDMSGNNSWVGDGAKRWLRSILTSIVQLERYVTPERLINFIHKIDTDDGFLENWIKRCHGLPNDEYSTFVEVHRNKHTSERQYSAIMGKIKDDFDWSPDVVKQLSGDVDYLAYIADPSKSVLVNLITPSGSGKELEGVTRLVVGIAQLHCIYAFKGALPVFYLDEAATCGKAEFIKKAVSEFRKYFQVILIYQSLGQLNHLFGKEGAQEILDSCGQQIYFGGGIRALESAKTLAESIGKKTIHVDRHLTQAAHYHRADMAMWDAMWNGEDIFSAEHIRAYELAQSQRREHASRYAVDPAELMRIRDKIFILSPGKGLYPILADYLPPYWLNTMMAGKYAPDPLFPPLDRVTLQGRFRKYTRRFIQRPVPKYLEHLPNHSNGQIAYVDGFKTW